VLIRSGFGWWMENSACHVYLSVTRTENNTELTSAKPNKLSKFVNNFLTYLAYLVRQTVVVVVLSSVDVGDPPCPIHGDDVIFTHII